MDLLAPDAARAVVGPTGSAIAPRHDTQLTTGEDGPPAAVPARRRAPFDGGGDLEISVEVVDCDVVVEEERGRLQLDLEGGRSFVIDQLARTHGVEGGGGDRALADGQRGVDRA